MIFHAPFGKSNKVAKKWINEIFISWKKNHPKKIQTLSNIYHPPLKLPVPSWLMLTSPLLLELLSPLLLAAIGGLTLTEFKMNNPSRNESIYSPPKRFLPFCGVDDFWNFPFFGWDMDLWKKEANRCILRRPCACRAFLVAAFWTWSHWRVHKPMNFGYTLSETNIAPPKWWFPIRISFSSARFSGVMLVSGRAIIFAWQERRCVQTACVFDNHTVKPWHVWTFSLFCHLLFCFPIQEQPSKIFTGKGLHKCKHVRISDIFIWKRNTTHIGIHK